MTDAIRAGEPPQRIASSGKSWPLRLLLVAAAIIAGLRLWYYWDEVRSFDYWFGGVVKWFFHLFVTFALVVFVFVVWAVNVSKHRDWVVSIGAIGLLGSYFAVMLVEGTVGKEMSNRERSANEAVAQDVVDRIWEYIAFFDTTPDSLTDVGLEEPFYLHRGSVLIEVRYQRENDAVFEVSYSYFGGGRDYYFSARGEWEGQY